MCIVNLFSDKLAYISYKHLGIKTNLTESENTKCV
jgi:hypothetical protein